MDWEALAVIGAVAKAIAAFVLVATALRLNKEAEKLEKKLKEAREKILQ